MSFDPECTHGNLPTYALRRHRPIIQLTTIHSPPAVCFNKSNMAPNAIDTILYYVVIVLGIVLASSRLIWSPRPLICHQMTLYIEDDVPREITLSLILEALIVSYSPEYLST